LAGDFPSNPGGIVAFNRAQSGIAPGVWNFEGGDPMTIAAQLRAIRD
jgi:hypothetical protein